MKKSEIIYKAMLCVAENWSMAPAEKLEVLEFLMGEKSLAEYVEKMDEEKE